MSSSLVTMMAILLAVFSLRVNPVSADMHLSQDDTLQECGWSNDLLAVASLKKELHTKLAVPPTLCALVNVVEELEQDPFFFYLPIYSLYREKSYFLLV